MLRILAALALSLAACAQDPIVVAPTDVDDSWIRETAEGAWAEAGVQAPTGYTLVFVAPEELPRLCHLQAPAQGYLAGCAQPGRVLLGAGIDPDIQTQTLIHELGHLMRGVADLSHPPCTDRSDQNRDVMCAAEPLPLTIPTARDVAFVRR